MAKIDVIEIPSLLFQEVSAPATPASGFGRLYVKTTGLFFKGDDGSEIGPLAAAAGSTVSYDHLTADETGKTNATLTDTSLSFAVTSGVYYTFRHYLRWATTDTTVGLKIGMTTPTFTAFNALVAAAFAADGVDSHFEGQLSSSGDSVILTSAGSTNDQTCIIEGLLLPSANGTLMLQYAAETTGATVTLKQASAAELITHA